MVFYSIFTFLFLLMPAMVMPNGAFGDVFTLEQAIQQIESFNLGGLYTKSLNFKEILTVLVHTMEELTQRNTDSISLNAEDEELFANIKKLSLYLKDIALNSFGTEESQYIIAQTWHDHILSLNTKSFFTALTFISLEKENTFEIKTDLINGAEPNSFISANPEMTVTGGFFLLFKRFLPKDAQAINSNSHTIPNGFAQWIEPWAA